MRQLYSILQHFYLISMCKKHQDFIRFRVLQYKIGGPCHVLDRQLIGYIDTFLKGFSKVVRLTNDFYNIYNISNSSQFMIILKKRNVTSSEPPL
jgi:hypothetical protein